ncbi:MAG: AAA-like domain-containing protein [Acidobacteria bacterium]|nr:AAA-like domain-containing protein [Acidobacteriota bacterium]
MNASAKPQQYFVAGGTLPRSIPCYVTRRADAELHQALQAGEFAYVLTSRQMGKSSLMVRVSQRLQSEGALAVIADLTALGQQVSPSQWYYGLAERISEQTIGAAAFQRLALTLENLPPVQFWRKVMESVVEATPKRVIIFIDEIDAVLSLPFSTDEFFAAIRELYNRRSSSPEFQRLGFCLLGVASPSDLIRDTRTTPFNVGRRIELSDFSAEEAETLAAGLPGERTTASRLLERVLYWTGGHPYLTQMLCHSVSMRSLGGPPVGGEGTTRSAVDEPCRALFLSRDSRTQDDNLLFVRERLLKARVDTTALLALYGRVLRGRRVESNERNELENVLRLAGIVKAEGGRLRPRNRIYKTAFDRRWVAQSLPGAEVRRQRAAFRRGLALAGGIAAVIFGVIATLGYTVLQQRDENRRQLYVADLTLAQQALARHEQFRARDLLRAHIPAPRQKDLRNFEWYALWNQAAADSPLVEINPGPGVVGAVASRDGSRVFAATASQIAEYGSADGRLRRVIVRFDVPLQAFAISPDEQWMLAEDFGPPSRMGEGWSPGSNGRVMARSMADGHLLFSEPFTAMPQDGQVALSGDGQWAIAFDNSSIHLWRTRDWHETIHQTRDETRFAALSRHGNRIALATRDRIEIWSASFGARLATFPANQPRAAHFCPDDSCLMFGDYNAIKLLDFKSHRLRTIGVHQGFVNSLSLSPDGKLLASCSRDQSLRIWELASATEVRAFQPHSITCLAAFFPDGERLLTSQPGADDPIRIFPRSAPPAMEAGDEVYAIAFSPDSRRFAVAGNDGKVLLWDAQTSTLGGSLDAGERVESLAFPDAKTLVAGTRHRVALRNLEQPGSSSTLARSDAPIMSAVSPNGRLAAIADRSSGEVRVLELPGGALVASYKAAIDNPKSAAGMLEYVVSNGVLSFAHDSRTLALCCLGSDIIVWEPAGKPTRLRPTDGSSTMAFSRNDRYLYVGQTHGDTEVWDWRQRRMVALLKGHRAAIKSLSLSPDGSRLVSTSDDGRIAFWDTATLQLLLSLDESAMSMEVAAFSPDGRYLAISGDDRKVRLWEGLRKPQ